VSRRAVALFIALGLAWGIPYLLIKVAVAEISPAALVLSRTVLAAALLLPVALARGAVVPVLRRWKWLVAFMMAEIAVPWVALGSAEQRLPSSTTGLLIAAVPLAGVGLALVTGRAERLGGSAWLGIGMGIAGVGGLLGFDLGISDVGAIVELGVVVVGYAVGPAILARQLGGLPGIGVMSVALTVAAVVYVPIVWLSDGVPSSWPSANVVWSVVLLAVVCTAAAFLLLFALVAEVGPVRATTITYVNPAVAVVAGAVFLGEPVTAWKLVGFLLVVTGSYLVNRQPSASRTQSEARTGGTQLDLSEGRYAADNPDRVSGGD
jgi:drug/metabolite transporter (DMT)-like permease